MKIVNGAWISFIQGELITKWRSIMRTSGGKKQVYVSAKLFAENIKVLKQIIPNRFQSKRYITVSKIIGDLRPICNVQTFSISQASAKL